MMSDVTPRHEQLGGTHHGRIPPAPERPERRLQVKAKSGNPIGPPQHAPRDHSRIRLVLDRHDVRRVLDGTKTAHARLWKRTDPDDGPCKTGDRIAVQKRGAGVVLHVIVQSVDMRELGEMDIVEARRHGFRTTRNYQRHWLSQHDPRWSSLTADQLADATDEDVAAAWERWSGLSVWVLTFTLDTVETDVYVAQGIGTTTSPDRSVDYDEIEQTPGKPPIRVPIPMVTGAPLERIVTDAETRREQFIAELTAEQIEQRKEQDDAVMARFTVALATARGKGINPHAQIRLVRRALSELERAVSAKLIEERQEQDDDSADPAG